MDYLGYQLLGHTSEKLLVGDLAHEVAGRMVPRLMELSHQIPTPSELRSVLVVRSIRPNTLSLGLQPDASLASVAAMSERSSAESARASSEVLQRLLMMGFPVYGCVDQQ